MTHTEVKEHICKLGHHRKSLAKYDLIDILWIIYHTVPDHREFDRIINSVAEYILPILEEEEDGNTSKISNNTS